MKKVNFNIKGVIYGVIVMVLIIGGFIVIPNMFMEQSKPVDYTILLREAIQEKILDMMVIGLIMAPRKICWIPDN